MRLALFIPCYVDTLFPQAGQATVRVLRRLGHELHYPAEQTCCGQMHVNTGYQHEAIPLVRNFVRAFGAYDRVVAPSASCVGEVREIYPRLARLARDPALVEAVDALVPRVHELTSFLVEELGVEDVGAYFPHRVTFHPTCHSQRVLHIGDSPQRLLGRVRGIELVPLPDANECCGFGGTFSVKNADTSSAMLASKVARVLETGAEVCAAADNSCLMHIGGALHRQRTGVRTLHVAEILASTEARPWRQP
jgi:L-lactate dehydrogenase complex protein LldE